MARPAPNPRTRFIRPFATHVVNQYTRLFVHRVPGFALLIHRGRRSGAVHRTPMNVFRDGDDYLFALTYGSNVQWVKNILAAGEADLRVGDKTIHLTAPQVFVDPTRRLMPQPVRTVLGVMQVSEFLRMRPSSPAR